MKTKPTDPELAAWCAALVPPPAVDVVPEGYFTAVQLAEKLGRARASVGHWLTDAVAAGKVETKKFRVAAGNRGVYPTPHYRIKK